MTKTAQHTPTPLQRAISIRDKSLAVMFSIAKAKGYRAKLTDRGDISCRSNGRQRGIIIVIPSEFSPGALVPIATFHFSHPELEEVRSAMCDALMEAGIIEPAQKVADIINAGRAALAKGDA